MKRHYTDPVLETRAFENESIITGSGMKGTAVDSIDETQYSSMSVDYDDLGILF